MFFELSNGTIINLNHVVGIPTTSFPLVSLTMIDGSIRRMTTEDVVKIRTHLRSLLINHS